MYDHPQNQVTDPASNLPLPEAQRRPYDEESRVSTDSDLDLTDFDEEEEDEFNDDEDDEMIDDEEVEEERGGGQGRGQRCGWERQHENRSTFSGVLMRKLRMLEQRQQHDDEDVNSPAEVNRPPLLAVADDSFSAKMRRVLKWTHSIPSDTVSESSESNPCSPAMIPAPMLSTPPTQSRKRRLSDAIFADDDTNNHNHHHITLVLKRPRIAGVFSPSSAPGSPFFSSAPRLYPFPISTTAAPARQVFNPTSRAHLPKSCDYDAPPIAEPIVVVPMSTRSPILGSNTGANITTNPIKNMIQPNGILAVHLNTATVHVCAACDHSFASSRCFIRHWHGASTSDACRAAVSYGLGVE